MTRKAFTEHPDFLSASHAATVGLRAAMDSMGLPANALDFYEVSADRIADELTRLLLRAADHRKSA